MRKTFKSQMLSAAVMLVVAAVALTGATYAWFSNIADPSVGTLDLQVAADDSLFISSYDTALASEVTGDKWRASVSQSEINTAQSGVFSGVMKDVSTVGTDAYHDFFRTSGFLSTMKPESYTAATLGSDYVRFTFWVRSSKDASMFLNGGAADPLTSQLSYVVAADSAGTPLNHFAATDTDRQQPQYAIAYTVRIAFVPLVDTSTPGTFEVEDWTGAVIWEPNSDLHLAIDQGGPGGTDVIPTDSAVKTAGPAGTAGVDDGVQPAVDFTGGKLTLGSLLAGRLYRYAVYMWVEGSDPDTVNAVANSYFQAHLRFGAE